MRALRAVDSGARVVLVPTMGALHEGHISLLAEARRMGTHVVASIFVNPLQFAQLGDLARYPRDDLARYPRDEAGDLEKLRAAGCDLAWLPDVATMYPAGDATTVDVGGPALGWEGAARPGHFRGVATVVCKLFGQCKPEAACFGEKDWQQLQVIRRVQADLSLGVQVVGVKTMRETDGLAMSSRNRFLSPADRQTAPILHRGLQETLRALRQGEAVATALAGACAALQAAGLAVDYLALVDGPTLLPIESLQTGARLIAAARLGSVRLLDNIGLA